MKKLFAMAALGLAILGAVGTSTSVSAHDQDVDEAKVRAAVDARLHQLLRQMIAQQTSEGR
ncbi:MAG: hypothetical protein ACOZIN_05045 [Myxococcota bacterium]